MDNLEFELHKVRREIKRHGNEYVFYRKGKNEFGEPIGEEERVCVVKGIYHEERGYVSLKTQDGANIKSKSEPQILCVIKQEDDGYDEGFIMPFGISGVIDVDFGVVEGDGTDEEFGGHNGSQQNYDVSERVLKQGDIVYVGSQTYKVINITDIQNYGIIANISLGLVV